MFLQFVRLIKNFREELHDLIPKRADSTLDLLDALASNDKADSVVQLSLSPLFRRKYSSITDVVSNFPELVEKEEPRKPDARPQLEQKSSAA